MIVNGALLDQLLNQMVVTTTSLETGLSIQRTISQIGPAVVSLHRDETLAEVVKPLSALHASLSVVTIDEAYLKNELVSTLRRTVAHLKRRTNPSADQQRLLDWIEQKLSPLDSQTRAPGIPQAHQEPMEAFLKSFIEASPNPMLVFRNTGEGAIEPLFFNQARKEVSGLIQDHMAGVTLAECYHPDDVAQVEKLFRDLIQKDAVSLNRVRLKVTEGVENSFVEGENFYLWVDVHAGMIKGTDLGYLTLINQSERHDAVEFKSILESVLGQAEHPLGIFEIDDNGYPKGILNSRAFAQMLGYPADETGLHGVKVEDVVPQKNWNKLAEHLEGFHQTGEIRWQGAEMIRADGTTMEVDIHARASTVSGRTFAVAFYVASEIRRAAEREREEANKHEISERMRKGLIHDINNYLGSVLGFLNLVLMRVSGKLKGDLQAVYDHAELIKYTLADYQSLTDDKTARDPVNIHDLLSHRKIRIMLSAGILFDTILTEDPWFVAGPSSHVAQIIMNLLVNATDAMVEIPAAQKHVFIRTDKIVLDQDAIAELNTHQDLFPSPAPGEYMQLVVTDRGKGIAEVDLPKIFGFGYSTKDPKQESLRGRGLFNVYQRVSERGGFVTVDSTIGQGTTFHIYLPRFDSETIDVTSPGGETILVVEDDRSIRDLLQDLLPAYNYDAVLRAPNGVEAMKILKDHPEVTAIITDLKMSGMSGDQLVARARTLRPEIPVLIHSGRSKKGLKQDERTVFVKKPWEADSFMRALRRVINAAASSH